MSKRAEDAAIRKYPLFLEYYPKIPSSTCGPDGFTPTVKDYNAYARQLFQEGYEQAEKDIGWISVKDRLPDTTDYMFTCIEMNGIPQCVGFHYYKNGKWFEGFEEDTVGAVEYWMPIPKLPKEDEK